MMGVLKPTYVSVTLVISTVSIPSSYTLPSLWPLSTPHIAGLHGFGGEASAGGGWAGLSQGPNLVSSGLNQGQGFFIIGKGSCGRRPGERDRVSSRPTIREPKHATGI